MVFIFLNGRKEGNVLFNDALKTFLPLYGVRYMVEENFDRFKIGHDFQ